MLGIVAILATYGRHLAATLEQRSVARGFATIARYFGTVAFDTILAHILRGLMRARALERLLLRRAARGRDLRVLPPRAASRHEPPAEDAADVGQTAGSAPPELLTPVQDAVAQAAAPAAAPAALAAASEAEPRPTRRTARDAPLTLDTLPDLAEIDAEVRRNPVGSTVAAICRDFGISPSLCDGMFWNRLFDAIRLFGGSLPSLVLEVKRRERRFEKDEWKHRGLDLPEESRDGIRRVLGFLIGEQPVDPFAVAAAPIASPAPEMPAAMATPGVPIASPAPEMPAAMATPGVPIALPAPGARGAATATGPP
jgi:hypothetical protein